jgi:hypothetical protein
MAGRTTDRCSDCSGLSLLSESENVQLSLAGRDRGGSDAVLPLCKQGVGSESALAPHQSDNLSMVQGLYNLLRKRVWFVLSGFESRKQLPKPTCTIRTDGAAGWRVWGPACCGAWVLWPLPAQVGKTTVDPLGSRPS